MVENKILGTYIAHYQNPLMPLERFVKETLWQIISKIDYKDLFCLAIETKVEKEDFCFLMQWAIDYCKRPDGQYVYLGEFYSTAHECAKVLGETFKVVKVKVYKVDAEEISYKKFMRFNEL